MAVWTGAAILLIFAAAFAAIGFDRGISKESKGDRQPKQFQSLYEPSGVVQLPDGRILVIEDENLTPFSILVLDDAGESSTKRLQTPSLLDMALGKPRLSDLEDLEGIDVDDRGYVYAITSHSRMENGKRDRTREMLVRFRLDGDKMVELKEIKNLRRAITKVHEVLDEAVDVTDVKDDNGFNIEGLSFDRTNRQLLIALRSPVVGKKGIIVVLENPDAVFDGAEKPKISDKLISLKLANGGIRAIAFDPKLAGYLIISRREDKNDHDFKLWFWNGDPGHAPDRVKVSGKNILENAEGITPINANGKEQLLIVFDDGSSVRSKGAHYLILDYEDLNFALR